MKKIIMTKTEIKQQAQEDLLHFAGHVFYSLYDDQSTFSVDASIDNTEKLNQYKNQLDKQYKRMQKLFGYEQTGYKG